MQYSIEPRKKYRKEYRFLSSARILSNKYKKQLLNTWVDSLKIASKKVVHKAGEFLRNKIANKIVKPKHVIDENEINFEEIIIHTRKNRRNIKRIVTSIIKMEHYKISKLLNDSTASKFVTKRELK